MKQGSRRGGGSGSRGGSRASSPEEGPYHRAAASVSLDDRVRAWCLPTDKMLQLLRRSGGGPKFVLAEMVVAVARWFGAKYNPGLMTTGDAEQLRL